MDYMKNTMNTTKKYKEHDKKGNCKCGHNHINFVGDLGKYNDEEGFDLISSCCYCNCENFKFMNAQELINETELSQEDLTDLNINKVATGKVARLEK
jgi:hypothetical protein